MKIPLLLSLFAAGLVSPVQAEMVAIQAGHVLIDASQSLGGSATIFVENAKIIRIEQGHAPTQPGVRVINLKDKTVLPGLIDMHVHFLGDPGGDYRDEAVLTNDYLALIGAKNAAITVKAGFTTVRDLGSTARGGFALRDATAKGLLPGPRCLVPAFEGLGRRASARQETHPRPIQW